MTDTSILAPTSEDLLVLLHDAVAEIRRLGQLQADLRMKQDQTDARMKAARSWADSVRAQLDDAILGER